MANATLLPMTDSEARAFAQQVDADLAHARATGGDLDALMAELIATVEQAHKKAKRAC